MNSTDPSPQDHDDAAAVALEPVMEPLSDDNDEDLASLLAKRGTPDLTAPPGHSWR